MRETINRRRLLAAVLLLTLPMLASVLTIPLDRADAVNSTRTCYSVNRKMDKVTKSYLNTIGVVD